MDEKFTEATTNRPQGDRALDAPLVTIDLRQFIAQIKEEEQWKKSDRNAITIFKSLVMRIVLIALHKGAEMKTHTATGTISVQVIEGEMQFTANDQTIILYAGEMLVLQEAIPHSVLAKVETVFLLTLTTS
jgi:quercetin dioxygenase-like cupin family protein